MHWSESHRGEEGWGLTAVMESIRLVSRMARGAHVLRLFPERSKVRTRVYEVMIVMNDSIPRTDGYTTKPHDHRSGGSRDQQPEIQLALLVR